MPPVIFRLRMYLGVTVDLAGGGLEDLCLHPLGETQHINSAMHTGLGGLNRIMLIMNG